MPSFDIVSKIQWSEVDNALNQALKEIGQRYDFKDTDTEVEKNKDGFVLRANSEDRVKAAWTVLQEKLVKRKVSLTFFEAKKPEASGKHTRMTVAIKDGIDAEKAKKLVQLVKDQKLKVQAAIQDQQLRITGKNRDDLQATIQAARAADLGIELQFINFRD
ncbi:MAG: YajQ family cyclic di-GMP-binding protein [Polyangiaceae bacterium]